MRLSCDALDGMSNVKLVFMCPPTFSGFDAFSTDFFWVVSAVFAHSFQLFCPSLPNRMMTSLFFDGHNSSGNTSMTDLQLFSKLRLLHNIASVNATHLGG